MITYAQNFEDVILARALADVTSGSYIDVGSWHPVTDSVTKHFYDAGWSGTNVDPGDQYWDLLLSERPRDTNLHVALAAKAGTQTYFEVLETGWSGFDPAIPVRAREAGYEVRSYEVPVSTLAEVCAQHQSADIHFLKVDVEGAEPEVIAGGDWDTYRPWVVVVETLDPVTQVRTNSGDALIDQGYIKAYFDGLNDFFVRVESAHLAEILAMPPNLFDDFITPRQNELEHFYHKHQWGTRAKNLANRWLGRSTQ